VIFSENGARVARWGGPFAINISGRANGWFKTATAVAVGPQGNIFVADFYNHRIQKFTAAGKFLVAFGSRGKNAGQFEGPTDVAVDADGNVYVVDLGNNRIEKFTPLR